MFKKKTKYEEIKNTIEWYEEMFKLNNIDFKEPQTQLIDNFMINILQRIYGKMQDKKDGGEEVDWWIVVIGSEGSGKSTFTGGLIWEYCKISGIDFVKTLETNVAFDDEDMVRFIAHLDTSNKFRFIWADEGANVFFNRESNTKSRRYAIKFMNSMRHLRYFVVICAVELSQLDRIIKDHRVKTLIRIQDSGNDENTRIYHYYNYEQLTRLIATNEKNRDRNFNWRSVEPEHVGSFKWSPETKYLVDMLKTNYFLRFKQEAQLSYYKMITKKLENILDDKQMSKNLNEIKL